MKDIVFLEVNVTGVWRRSVEHLVGAPRGRRRLARDIRGIRWKYPNRVYYPIEPGHSWTRRDTNGIRRCIFYRAVFE